MKRARPKLTAENVVDYLDWVTENMSSMLQGHVDTHLKAAELAIRTRMGEAQAKDTQHTLVRDGIIAPRPPPPGVVRACKICPAVGDGRLKN